MSKKIVPLPSSEVLNNAQIDLFQNFLCNNAQERDSLSNTIELWDSLPIYTISPRKMNSMRSSEGLLPRAEKSCIFKKNEYKIKITAAIIDDESTGGECAYYPSANEELIEDTLRKIAAKQNYGFFDQPAYKCGVIFSLHAVREELKQRGHSRSYQEIIKSLKILSGSHIEISHSNGKAIAKSNYLPFLAGVSRTDFLENPSSRWIAHFHPLITQSIDKLSYRQFNYGQMMEHNSQLARWLHKKLSHNFLNASHVIPYTTLFSTLKRDSGGLLDWKRTNDSVRRLDDALDELVKHKVLISYEKIEERQKQNKIVNIKYILLPHSNFIRDVKAANKRQEINKEQLTKYQN